MNGKALVMGLLVAILMAGSWAAGGRVWYNVGYERGMGDIAAAPAAPDPLPMAWTAENPIRLKCGVKDLMAFNIRRLEDIDRQDEQMTAIARDMQEVSQLMLDLDDAGWTDKRIKQYNTAAGETNSNIEAYNTSFPYEPLELYPFLSCEYEGVDRKPELPPGEHSVVVPGNPLREWPATNAANDMAADVSAK